MREREPGNHAGNGGRRVATPALGQHLLVGLGGGRCRRGFAVIDGHRFATAEPNDHEAATAEAARLRMGDGEREGDGHRGIDGVAPTAEHVDADAGGMTLDRGHHARGSRGGLAATVHEADRGLGGGATAVGAGMGSDPASAKLDPAPAPSAAPASEGTARSLGPRSSQHRTEPEPARSSLRSPTPVPARPERAWLLRSPSPRTGRPPATGAPGAGRESQPWRASCRPTPVAGQSCQGHAAAGSASGLAPRRVLGAATVGPAWRAPSALSRAWMATTAGGGRCRAQPGPSRP